MRELRTNNSHVNFPQHNHKLLNQFKALNKILELVFSKNPTLLESLAKGIRPAFNPSKSGRPGLDVEQVLRILLLKQITQDSWDTLSFWLADSLTMRAFCKLRPDQNPCDSTLQATVNSIDSVSLEQFNQVLVRMTPDLGCEEWLILRIDTTVVDAAILSPRDENLLLRFIKKTSRLFEKFNLKCRRRHKAALRAFRKMFTKSEEKRKEEREILLHITVKVLKDMDRLIGQNIDSKIKDQLRDLVGVGCHVYLQASERWRYNNILPSDQKIVSLDERHVDIITKKNGYKQEVRFGHKIVLATGASGLVSTCKILKGNPCDKSLFIPALNQHQFCTLSTPSQVASDGGFASKKNYKEAKEIGILRVAFSKNPKTLDPEVTAGSKKHWTRLFKFRAGIEANISWLKRRLGLGRCTWKGELGFARFVHSTILAANLWRLSMFALSSSHPRLPLSLRA